MRSLSSCRTLPRLPLEAPNFPVNAGVFLGKGLLDSARSAVTVRHHANVGPAEVESTGHAVLKIAGELRSKGVGVHISCQRNRASRNCVPLEVQPYRRSFAMSRENGDTALNILQEGALAQRIKALRKGMGLTPGFIEVHSVRITERGIGTTGVYLVFKDSTFTGNTRPVRVGLAYLDKPEIQMMRDALQAEREYIDKAAKTPPQNQEEMNWESTEGVRIGVSLLEGSPTYYAHIPVRNGDDSETIGLTLSPEAAESLMTKITGALNLAEGGK